MKEAPNTGTPELAEGHARRAVEGCAESLDWIVQHLYGFLHALASDELRGVLSRHYDPADLVNDAWVRVFPMLGTLKGEHGYLVALRGYLGRTIHRRATELLDKALRDRYVQLGSPRPGEADDSGWSRVPADVTSVFAQKARSEDQQRVIETLAEMDALDRRIVLMRTRGLSFKAIGAAIQMKENSVNKRFERARAELRRRLPDSVLDVF